MAYMDRFPGTCQVVQLAKLDVSFFILATGKVFECYSCHSNIPKVCQGNLNLKARVRLVVCTILFERGNNVMVSTYPLHKQVH